MSTMTYLLPLRSRYLTSTGLATFNLAEIFLADL